MSVREVLPSFGVSSLKQRLPPQRRAAIAASSGLAGEPRQRAAWSTWWS